jgi:hypothetical protein
VEAEEDVEREREVEASEGLAHETETGTAGGGEKGPWGRAAEAAAAAAAAVVASSMAAARSGQWSGELSEAALACQVWCLVCVGGDEAARGSGVGKKISRSLPWF